MSLPKIRAGVYVLQNSDFTTLISKSNSSSLVPFQKCCKYDYFYSLKEKKCVSRHFHASSPNSDLRLDPSKLKLYDDFPCLYPDYWYSEVHSSQIKNIFPNGSADVHLNGEKRRHLEWGQFCLDVDKETRDYNPILVTCDQLLPIKSMQLGCSSLYLVSLLLLATTFSLHLAMPELRAKVKDKCFICYLACLMLWMIIYADVWGMNGINFLKKFLSINVAFSLEFYSIMATFSWVNVMCIHLWRTVTTLNSIPPRSFYFYALYAMGLPLVCKILFLIDRSFSGLSKFSRRIKKGAGPFSNPVLLYMVDICTVQLIINIGILFRVGYIIWNQKQRWNGKDVVSMKHHYQQKTMLSQLLRLFIIMHLEWIYIFMALYFGIERMDNALLQFRFWVKLCLGYFIFIVYVCCNKQVISSLRKRSSKKSREGVHISISFISHTPTP